MLRTSGTTAVRTSAGALALGMTAVRYTGIADRADERFPEATSVIADLADLPGVLGDLNATAFHEGPDAVVVRVWLHRWMNGWAR